MNISFSYLSRETWLSCFLVIFSFIILGGLFILLLMYHRKPSVGPLSNMPMPKEVTITLTDQGFTPSEVTIRKGMAVRWINNSTLDKASVNSDDYPTNRLYPELNLGQFNRGSSLVHVFKNNAHYTYHNQFNPKQIGTITVE